MDFNLTLGSCCKVNAQSDKTEISHMLLSHFKATGEIIVGRKNNKFRFGF
jgi:hypothetical protein